MLQPMSSQRVGHDLATEQSQQHLRVSHQGKAGSKRKPRKWAQAWGLSKQNYLCLELFLLSFLFSVCFPPPLF